MHAPVLSCWPLLLAATVVGPVGAQTPAVPASVPASVAAYRSAFDGYRGFDDQPVSTWKASNDTVGRIGGWRAYAQEASGHGSLQHPPPVVPAQAGTQRNAPALPKTEALDSRVRGNDGN